MWRLLLIPFILLNNPCYGIPTSSGPTSDEEAKVLWTEGETAVLESRYQDASNYFQRYCDRYPGSPSYLKAHLYLGKALLELGKPEKAVQALKKYLSSTANTPEGARGRIWLGHAYLDLRKYQEAYLTTLEIDQMENQSFMNSDILLEARLVKTQALLGLKHAERATQVLDSALGQISDKSSPEVTGQAYGLKLKLKILECERLPSKDRLDESQVRDQLERRGICLLESILLYHRILKAGDLRSSAVAVTQVTDSFDDYAKSCKGPFPPPLTSHHKRTPREMRQYQAELADRLKKDCKQKWVAALDLLNSWKPGLPPAMLGSLLQTTQSLQKYLSRAP